MCTFESQTCAPDRIGGYQALEGILPSGRLRCRSKPELSWEWIIGAIEGIRPRPGRSHGVAALPETGHAFVKVHQPRPRYSLWRLIRHSRAMAEARGYLTFANAGIEVPELLAWGEVRSRGKWKLGFVITRAIESRTAADAYRSSGDSGILESVAAALARIHNAQLAHGDPGMQNFLVSRERTATLDLSGWGRLTLRRRKEDLVRHLGTSMIVADSRMAQRMLAAYSESARWSAAGSRGVLRDAEGYGRMAAEQRGLQLPPWLTGVIRTAVIAVATLKAEWLAFVQALECGGFL